jgi:hypothetical protein
VKGWLAHQKAKAAARRTALVASLKAEHAALVANGHAADADEVYGSVLAALA